MITVATLMLLISLLCGEAFSFQSSTLLSSNFRKIAISDRNVAPSRRSLFFIPSSLQKSHLCIHNNSALFSSTNNGDDISITTTTTSSEEADRLRQKALQLRAEADAAEQQISPSRSSRSAAATLIEETNVEYYDINDSCWELSYRFANEPESKDGDNNDNVQKRIFYSGKVKLQFLSDGYTNNLSNNDNSSEQQPVTIKKVWGWDIEVSDQDSNSYILFSADITLPPPIDRTERFYFQARVDDGGQEEKNGKALSLQEGSVTVKRDISAPSGGWWGIFRGADGILAQFRQLGEFRCRPIAKP